jgi:signal transduction histidine kinase
MRMGPTPVIHIDNVRSGRYNLRVRFITGSGSESITERSFPLVVEQYFYTRPAFYVAIIGALLIFIVLYVRGTMIRDRRLLEVRQELAADLHDEIGGYLTGLYMQIDLMSRNPQQSEWKFVTLRNQARKAVFALKDGLWSLDTKTDNAQQLWDRFKRIAQESLEPLDIPYRFSGFDNMASIALTLMEKRNLLFILKECLTNAIKHGDGRGVWFEWKRHQNGGHQIVVENGWNADHSERQGEGQGLENIRQRIARIRGNAHFTAASGKFIVTLNLILKHDRIGRD